MQQENIIVRESGSYPESWYPVMRSCDLVRGQLKPLFAFEREWVIFRGMDGSVGVVNRLCCHMGADLIHGKVSGNALECSLHGWQFDHQGRCCHSHEIYGDTSSVKLKSLHCQETLGLVFVHWGSGEPVFSLPVLPDHSVAKAHESILDAPYYIGILNGFDLNHMEIVHNRRPLIEPDIFSHHPFNLTLVMEAEVIVKKWSDRIMSYMTSGRTKVEVECWSGNFVWMKNPITHTSVILASLPLSQTRSRFFVFGTDMSGREKSLFAALKLYLINAVAWSFFSIDQKILAGMRPFRNRKFAEADSAIQKIWDFYESLPRYGGQ